MLTNITLYKPTAVAPEDLGNKLWDSVMSLTHTEGYQSNELLLGTWGDETGFIIRTDKTQCVRLVTWNASNEDCSFDELHMDQTTAIEIRRHYKDLVPSFDTLEKVLDLI